MSAPPFDPNDAVITFSDTAMPDTDSAPWSDAPPDDPESSPDGQPNNGDPRSTMTRIMGEKRRFSPNGQAKQKRGSTKEKAEKPTPPKDRPGALVKPLQDMYASIGIAVFAIDQECGRAILDNAEGCANALDKAARENPALRRVIHRLIETSVMGAVIAAHAPIGIAIARHHVPSFRDAPTLPVNGLHPPQHSSNGSGNVA